MVNENLENNTIDFFNPFCSGADAEEIEPEEKFAVIGGQYERHFYGTADTLHKAKLLATRNQEYWDNWQGWHTPRIYRMEDCKKITTSGWITVPDGQEIIVPEVWASPFMIREGKRWVRICDTAG